MKQKTTVTALLIVLSLGACVGALTACKQEEAQELPVSGLIGRFNGAEAVKTKLTNDASYATKGEAGEYLYTSSVYPLNTIVEEEIDYATEQHLRLKRDFTYEYTYDIRLRKVTQSGNTELCKLSVEAYGTFDYQSALESETQYSVALSNPTSGSEKFYASYIADEGNVYSWKISATPTYLLDYATLTEGETFSRYGAGRTVEVVKAEVNELSDPIFYADFLNDFAGYFSYFEEQTPAVQPTPPEEEEPETPPVEEGTVQANLPVVYAQDSAVGVGIRLQEGCALLIETALSQITVDGVALTGTKVGAHNEFLIPVEDYDFSKNYEVKAGEQTLTVNAESYLREIASKIPATLTGDRAELKPLSDGALAINLLNLAGATLTEAEGAYLYPSKQGESYYNYYHREWTKRDYFDITEQDRAVEGFAWGSPNEGTLAVGKYARLEFPLSLPAGRYEKLAPKANVEGKALTATLVEKGVDGDKINYLVAVDGISPLDYEKGIFVTLFDGETQISSRLEYSVNRAIAKADFSSDATVRENAKTHYSLGKTAKWVAEYAEVTAVRSPAAVSGEGRFTVSYGQYSQDYYYGADAQSKFGVALYVGGVLVNDWNATVEQEAFTAQKLEGNRFLITLKGGALDGIFVADSIPSQVDIVVEQDATLSEVLAPMFGFNGSSGSIRVDCPLTITSVNGAKLTLAGGIVCQDLSVDGVNIRIASKLNQTAVECGALTVKNGGISVEYGNKSVTATASGIVVNGNLTLDGASLESVGFANGVWLHGDTAKQFQVNGASKVKLVASSYAINGSAPTFDGVASNRELILTGGECYFEGASGVKYCNVTVGNAKLTAIANGGYTVDAEDGARAVSFRTLSGSVEQGEVTLVNHTFNEYWDVYYVVKASVFHLNGGRVNISGMCRGGLIHATDNAAFLVENCDLTMSSPHPMAQAPKAFSFTGGGSLTVENTATLTLKNFQVAFNAWGSPATFVNRGFVVIDGYQCALNWELTTWESKLTVQDEGVIRYTNRVELE